MNDQQAETIRLTIFDALENRELENGHITRASIQDTLEQFRVNVADDVGHQIEFLRAEGFGTRNNGRAFPANNDVAEPTDCGEGSLFVYRGRFWDVQIPLYHQR